MANIHPDKHKLCDFVEELYGWLGSCYGDETSSKWLPTFPYHKLFNLGKLAWAEFKRDQPIETFNSLIQTASIETLKRHGLVGMQLEYKLSVIDTINRLMKSNLKNPNRPSVRMRLKLIDAIDTVLDSLISAIGAGTALKEIKDMLRAQIR
tara:strand:+ start:2364 stop:2816 length:453 start_codon:yes stop_codon:yes gene_type:complete